jgi:hypothetical protein
LLKWPLKALTSTSIYFNSDPSRIQEYQANSLKKYFEEDALLFPIQTIIEKTGQKDFAFFLGQRNFLKVVDTLEKFEAGVLDVNSKEAKEFTLFKTQLYKMYEIQNRSVWEHEQFSFNIEREDLKLLSEAKSSYLKELQTANSIDRLTNLASLKGKVFRRKMLDP